MELMNLSRYCIGIPHTPQGHLARPSHPSSHRYNTTGFDSSSSENSVRNCTNIGLDMRNPAEVRALERCANTASPELFCWLESPPESGFCRSLFSLMTRPGSARLA